MPLHDLPSVLSPQSPEAQTVLGLFWFVLAIAAAVLVTVVALIVVAIVRFRGRSGEKLPRQNTGNHWVEFVWTAVPSLILLVLFGATCTAMAKIQPPAHDRTADLDVTAHQWWWQGRYPKTGVVVANEFHVPVGQTLLLRFHSADVVHDWWVPELGRKVDVFPNHPTHLWMKATKPGLYLGTCDEFCGPEHAWMRIRVIVHSPADYARWTQQQLEPRGPPTDVDGAAEYRDRPCGSCHRLQGVSSADIGPDLTHIAGRQTLGAGVMENNLANLTRWLQNAQAVKPGCYMPNMQLDHSKASGLARYLDGV
jgi:cytochrome c oxidase subunit 2